MFEVFSEKKFWKTNKKLSKNLKIDKGVFSNGEIEILGKFANKDSIDFDSINGRMTNNDFRSLMGKGFVKLQNHNTVKYMGKKASFLSESNNHPFKGSWQEIINEIKEIYGCCKKFNYIHPLKSIRCAADMSKIEPNKLYDLDEEYVDDISDEILEYSQELETGIDIEREHKDTLQKIKDDVEKDGKIDITDEEFFKDIAEDHLEEYKDYYDENKGLPAMEDELSKDEAGAGKNLNLESTGGDLIQSFSNEEGTAVDIFGAGYSEDGDNYDEYIVEVTTDGESQYKSTFEDKNTAMEVAMSFLGDDNQYEEPESFILPLAKNKTGQNIVEAAKNKDKSRTDFTSEIRLTGTPDPELRKKQIDELKKAIDYLNKKPEEFEKEIRSLNMNLEVIEKGLEGKSYSVANGKKNIKTAIEESELPAGDVPQKYLNDYKAAESDLRKEWKKEPKNDDALFDKMKNFLKMRRVLAGFGYFPDFSEYQAISDYLKGTNNKLS